MSSVSPEYPEAAEPETGLFDTGRVHDIASHLTARLDRFKVDSPFERPDTLTDDEMISLVTLYALTSEDKLPVNDNEAGASEDKVLTREEFIARTVLLPTLGLHEDRPGAHKIIYGELAYNANTHYHALLSEQWAIDSKKAIVSNSYLSFINAVTRKLTDSLRENAFTREKTNGLPPVQIVTAYEPVQGRLKPEAPGMSEKVKLIRGLFDVADLNPEEAVGLHQMIRGSDSSLKFHPATLNALAKCRGLYYQAPGTPDGFKLTPKETKRITALLSPSEPKSLYDQIFEAHRDGDPDASRVERDLMNGLHKILVAYGATPQSVKE